MKQDRAAGALMGAFIGDALAVGPHWYYDLDEMRTDYGEWVDSYQAPLDHRYHPGLRPGDPSQAGHLLRLLTETVVEAGGYDEARFCQAMDDRFLPLLDGTPTAGPGGYTSQSIRALWESRIARGEAWGTAPSGADTTESIERCLTIAIAYSGDPEGIAEAVGSNTRLTQGDETVVAITVAFCSVLGLLVDGHPFDPSISDTLIELAHSSHLPYHVVTGENLSPPQPGERAAPLRDRFVSPDALLTPGSVASAAVDPGIAIEPAWKVSLVYGMPCAIYHQVPAAYYLAARFPGNFRDAVLHAVNGGGQNQARAILTGALAGAQSGLQGIPADLVDGLSDSARLMKLARSLGGLASRVA